MLFTIAFRNILRNRRRSAVTALAVAVGVLAMLMFGTFQTYVFRGFQTLVVQHTGHLTVFRKGYFIYGAGNPTEWDIDGYEQVMALIKDDPVLRPMLRVVTPRLQLSGIASYVSADNDAAKTFLSIGVVPSDRDRMRLWDEYGVTLPYHPSDTMRDDAPARGLLGVGMARILGICGVEGLGECTPRPARATPADAPSLPADLATLAADAATTDTAKPADGLPRINLIAATAGGTPNVVSLTVTGVDEQQAKELDDAYIGMHIALAQQLVYGRGVPKVTSIVLLLDRSEQMSAARARLGAIFREHGLPLEVRDFAELTSFYTQSLDFFDALFLFIAIIMGVIVLFTVVNTMTMAVVERTAEIGTTRALGLRRGIVRRQFVLEGCMLGVLGASLGVALTFVAAAALNGAGLTWTPPGNQTSVPFRVAIVGNETMVVGIWAALVVVATLAALIPANRAARLQVVDALRHA
jgi:putative ABC transport system permease protein